MGHHRQNHDGNHNGCGQRKGLGVGQRCKQLAFGTRHGEHGKKADDGRKHCRQYGTGHFLARIEDGGESRLLRIGLQMSHDVFAQHDTHVDNSTDRDGNTGQRDDVGVDIKDFHQQKRGEHRKWQCCADQQTHAQIDH